MKVDVLVAEIGSTTTVVNAFQDIDTENPIFWGQGQAPTSVMQGDVRIGLQGAIDDLCKNKGIESLEYDEMLATSSAAGGLKMTVHGLVYDMTAKAAKEAALGAGGILHFVTAGRLRRTDIAKIKEINPNLILIAGGVDYGERDTALDNAEMIRSMGLKTPVIYAGNVENQEEMKLIFDEESGMKLYNVENVYPKIDALNVEPCRKVIQDAFEDHITNAPGMEHVRDMVNGPIIPTPGAVMECTKLLYDCIGDLIVLDVGGATTDLHSVATESDQVARIMIAPEPKAKRTVEGDLGVYVNRLKVIESIGEEKIREQCQKIGIDFDKTLESYVAIPKTEDEIKLVEILTMEAVLRAVERHAGQIRYIYGPSGRSTVAEGKDLTQVKYIIGTGGALTRLPNRIEIMQKIAKHNETGMLLFPSEHAEILVDNDYIMASLGVLSKKHRQGAIKLLEKSLKFDFSTVKKEESYQTKYIDEVKKLAEEARAREEETKKHIQEMEKAGYDMEAYKNPDDIGGANANGARAKEIKKIIEEAERDGKLADTLKKKF
ncbi:MAG: GlmL-related ornithine degradation protein [Eubacteriales bacterium]